MLSVVQSAAIKPWQRNAAILLVLLVLVLLPLHRSFEVPFNIAAIAGLVLAWRERRELKRNPALRLVVMLFACYWLPALIAAPDSLAPMPWRGVLEFLRFLAFAAFVALTLCDENVWPRLYQCVALVVCLWLVDAWIQAFTGYSLGGAPETQRLTGIFGAGNPKLGPVLAVLSPFVLIVAREKFGRIGLAIAFLALLGPILLAGSRAAWIMYALVVVVLLWQETRTLPRFLGLSLGTIAVVALAVIVALHSSAAFDQRAARTLRALQGSEQSIDEASAGRLQIWGTAWRMFEAHPINGVGVRAFRIAYPQYAAVDDRFVRDEPCAAGEGACHPHNIVLEVLTETGIIGIVFWLAGIVIGWRAWLRADATARRRALAPALALAVMLFPLNGYFAFYSADWGLLLWWLLALYCAALNSDNKSTLS